MVNRTDNNTKISVKNLNLYYGENHALKDINMDIYENTVLFGTGEAADF